MAYAVIGRFPWVWLRRVGDTPPFSTQRESPPLVVEYLYRVLRRKEILVISGCQSAAFSIWSSGPLPPPSQPQRIRMEMAGIHPPRLLFQRRFELGGRSLPRRSARRKIP